MAVAVRIRRNEYPHPLAWCLKFKCITSGRLATLILWFHAGPFRRSNGFIVYKQNQGSAVIWSCSCSGRGQRQFTYIA
jgi:hypothetical protein